MVIVSAVICDKNGALLLSRQFQPLSINELKEVYITITPSKLETSLN